MTLKPTCAIPASTPVSMHASAIGPTVSRIVESAECISWLRPPAEVARAGSAMSANVERNDSAPAITIRAPMTLIATRPAITTSAPPRSALRAT